MAARKAILCKSPEHKLQSVNTERRVLSREFLAVPYGYARNGRYHNFAGVTRLLLNPVNKRTGYVFIIGRGGEGKSQLGIVLQEIFKSAMLTGSFQRIETDRFFRYNLNDKLLMLDDDMQMSALQTTGYI